MLTAADGEDAEKPGFHEGYEGNEGREGLEAGKTLIRANLR